jgi:hypothetical protein
MSRFAAVSSVLSPGESAFFPVLRSCIPRGFYVCPHVRLADLLVRGEDVSCGVDWEQLCLLCVDFVILDPAGFPCLVVELDDRSHLRADRRMRDCLLRLVLDEAKISLLSVKARRSYDLDFCRKMISDRLGSAQQKTPVLAGAV